MLKRLITISIAVYAAFLMSACTGGGSLPGASVMTQSTTRSTAPIISWSPATPDPYDFGTLHSGDQPVTQTFTLKNTGGNATSALKISLTGPSASPPPGYTITTNTCSATSLGKGKTCTVTVAYAFTAAGETDTATLKATSNKSAATALRMLTATSLPNLQTFNYTGGEQKFTVPPGVTLLNVEAVGAQGSTSEIEGPARCSTGPGGFGEDLHATVTVSPGSVVYVYVGGTDALFSGAGGFNGGGSGRISCSGGGGASDIRIGGNTITPTDYRVIVAGAGGGLGGANAGFSTGDDGSNPDASSPYDGIAATGGMQTSGGSGGIFSFNTIVNGFGGGLGYGGAGSNIENPGGGGGGGGYYGGGGGYEGASGAGGSSFVGSPASLVSPAPKVATAAQCDANGNGCITISW